jgi:O-antigen/teichoic acid export membrane protein
VFVKSVDLIRYLLRVILIFSLLNNKSSAYHLAFIDMAVSAVVFLSNLTYAILKEKLRINFLILFKSGLFPIKEYCSYAGLFFFNLIIEQLIWNTDSIIIGMRLNPTMVTIFSSGAIISAAFNSMTQIISSMVFPRIVMKFSTEKTQDNATVVMIKISRLQAFIAFYILGGYIILGKYFVTKIWLGDSFEQAWSTSLIVMVGTLFSSLMGSGHLILRAINKQVFFLVSEFIIFFSNVVATYFLVVPLGIKGAAYSTTVAYILGMIIFIIPYYIRTIGLDIKKYLKNILSIVIPMIILSLTLFGFTKVFAIDSFKSMILWGLLYSFLYGICCFLVSTKEEKNMIISFLKGWRK